PRLFYPLTHLFHCTSFKASFSVNSCWVSSIIHLFKFTGIVHCNDASLARQCVWIYSPEFWRTLAKLKMSLKNLYTFQLYQVHAFVSSNDDKTFIILY
ncbi:hypothetical protein L9F63_024213, partial [Diploptera punctata]